ncbi:MAG: hypothetical protein CM1200mP14_25790 [Gammaproteobacteria bacterium]|nr:MAG: hypothetical protein CM1200mP14_25790 [Gammaproteobacteria bacterium]
MKTTRVSGAFLLVAISACAIDERRVRHNSVLPFQDIQRRHWKVTVYPCHPFEVKSSS